MKSSCTKKEARFLEMNYLILPEKVMAKKLNRSNCFVRQNMKRLQLVVPDEIIEYRKKDSQFYKNHTPFNKGLRQADYMSKEMIKRTIATRFKKGQKPHNTAKADGVISVRCHRNRGDKVYLYRRLSLGNWRPLHQVRWEMFRGPVPDGYCLWFIDGDTMNIKLSNLEMITRAENARRNKSRFEALPPDLKKAVITLNKFKKVINEKQNNGSK